MIEVNVAVVCACLPAAQRFMKRHFGRTWLFSSRSVPKDDQQFTPSRTQWATPRAATDERNARNIHLMSVWSVTYQELTDDESRNSRSITGDVRAAPIGTTAKVEIGDCINVVKQQEVLGKLRTEYQFARYTFSLSRYICIVWVVSQFF